VQRIGLEPGGKVRIEVSVPKKEAHWLRESSVFTLERNFLGGVKLRAFTGDLDSKPLADGVTREVLRGDAAAEIPGLIASAKSILGNIEKLTDADSDMARTIAQLRGVAEKLNGRYGALGAALGSDASAAKVIESIDRANRLLESLGGLSAKLAGTVGAAEALIGRTDRGLFDAGGVMDESKKLIAQLNAALVDARASLKRVDNVLAQAEKIGANTAAATEDLVAVRAEVEATLRRIGGLVDDINRRWPFGRDSEIRLP
jgi:phospholipid/cholesterol/gamma-HCH transport system substrate-binding protein